MNPEKLIKGHCIDPKGRRYAIFATRDDAKTFARLSVQPRNGGRGKVRQCHTGEHYHVTRSFMGQRARARKDVK